MTRKRTNPNTVSDDVAARLKALKIAKAPQLAAMPKSIGVRQPASPMTAAQKARLANFHSLARTFLGK